MELKAMDRFYTTIFTITFSICTSELCASEQQHYSCLPWSFGDGSSGDSPVTLVATENIIKVDRYSAAQFTNNWEYQGVFFVNNKYEIRMFIVEPTERSPIEKWLSHTSLELTYINYFGPEAQRMVVGRTRCFKH